MRNETVNTISTLVLVTLSLITAGFWGVVIGMFMVSVQPSNTLQDAYRSYTHLKIYEDGSYVGEAVGGTTVTGCILQAPCNNNLQPAGGIR